MNDRTGPSRLARGYARVIVALRHVVPLAWIAAVVWASLTLPDLASAPTAPLEDLAAKNGAASTAQARAIEHFGFPLATDTSVVQRDPRGLPEATQRRTLAAAQAVRERRDPAFRDIRAAVPVINAGPLGNRRERSTTAVTYLFMSPDLAIDDRAELGRAYARGALGGQRGDVVGVTGAAPARLAQYEEIENALPLIEIASVVLIALIVGIAFRSIGAPLVALFTAGIAYGIAVRVLPWAGEQADVDRPQGGPAGPRRAAARARDRLRDLLPVRDARRSCAAASRALRRGARRHRRGRLDRPLRRARSSPPAPARSWPASSSSSAPSAPAWRSRR